MSSFYYFILYTIYIIIIIYIIKGLLNNCRCNNKYVSINFHSHYSTTTSTVKTTERFISMFNFYLFTIHYTNPYNTYIDSSIIFDY